MACSIYYDDNGLCVWNFQRIFDASDGGEIVRRRRRGEKNIFACLRISECDGQAVVWDGLQFAADGSRMGGRRNVHLSDKTRISDAARYFDVFHF